MIDIKRKEDYEIFKEILKEMARIPPGWKEKVFYENGKIMFSSPFTGNLYMEGEKGELISLYDFLAESEIPFVYDDGYFYTKMTIEECDWEKHIDLELDDETDRYYFEKGFDHKHSLEEGIEQLLEYDFIYEFLEDLLSSLIS